MHHKRRRAKHQRSGCLFCKPYKDERRSKTGPRSAERRLAATDAAMDERD